MKGKVGERGLVHWLNERDIHSARRTQQHNGNDGLSDVVAPDELSHWHIESKNVRTPSRKRNELKKWAEQLKRDCPDAQHPVLFMRSNRNKIPFIGLFFLDAVKSLRLVQPTFMVCVEESFNPSKILSGAKLTQRVYDRIFKGIKHTDIITVYEIEPGLEFYAMEGDDALAHMLTLEREYAAQGNRLPKPETVVEEITH